MRCKKQEKMIGRHPDRGIFNEWLKCTDTECTDIKIHRKLEQISFSKGVLSEIANWIILHHVSEGKHKMLERKKEILSKYNFEAYANSLELFPQASITQKGNLGEIILCEYLQNTSQNKNLVYRLKYNPNVDQSMKGDDVLLLNKEDVSRKIIIGESKYRKTSAKSSVQSVSEVYGKNLTLPISLTFIADRIFESGNEGLAERIYELNENLYKLNTKIINVGFILSDSKTSERVEVHMNSANKDFIIVSLGLEDPESLVSTCYEMAYSLIEGD